MRDEILNAIDSASTAPLDTDAGYLAGQVADRMREVCRLADAYQQEAYDTGLLLETVTNAVERLADKLASTN